MDASIRERFDMVTSVAQIVEDPDGHPVRAIANGRRSRPVGRYLSWKSRRALPLESYNELHDLWCVEVDPTVLRSRVQPYELRLAVDGTRYSYTPDREDILTGNAIAIIEVKDSFEVAHDPLYATKLNLARAVYEGLGWSFEVVERATIEAQPMFSAIEEYRVTVPHSYLQRMSPRSPTSSRKGIVRWAKSKVPSQGAQAPEPL